MYWVVHSVKRIIGGIEVIMVLNKKQILCYLCLLCVFLFKLTITGKHVEAATQVDGYKHFKHNALIFNGSIDVLNIVMIIFARL